MSKLSFRARALDATKPMPIYLAEELPDLPEYSAINRAVPQMPSGMEKEEECEHHLQRAICTGLIIPTPEVFPVEDVEFYDRCYPSDYKMPKQHIHMQPLWQEQEAPEYDIDSEDDRWLKQQRHPELTEDKFEVMMDKLERSSGQTVVTLQEAKLLLERSDDLVIAVYDYWLNKRLKTQHPLILSVRTECRPGQAANNPYLAFRRRTEKMQTRKNRKNDESSYEKMLKLRRDLARALTLLELVARREKAKRDMVKLNAALAEKRYVAKDFAGQMIAEIPQSRVTLTVPALVRREPPVPPPEHEPRQREKRPYTKRRKHRHVARECGVYTSSEEETQPPVVGTEPPDDGPFAFRTKPGCFYEMPTSTLCGDPVEGPPGSEVRYKHEIDERYRYTLTSLRLPHSHCIGFARRRMGRGGRLILDRIATPLDDLWPRLEFNFTDTTRYKSERAEEVDLETNRHKTPKTLTRDYDSTSRYPWRRHFRSHLHHNRSLWVKSPPTIYEDLSETVFSDVKCDSERTQVKGVKRAIEDSDSCDSDASLEPVEKEFENFLDDVNKKWLHFRPKTPPPAPAPRIRPDPTLTPVNPDTPITVELSAPSEDLFTTSEFTLKDLYGDNLLENDNSGTSLDISNDDLLNENLGLTEAQVESILSETDLKALDEDLKDDKKIIPEDLLEELVKDVEGRTRRRDKETFGCTSVSVTAIAPAEPIYVEKVAPPKPKKVEVKLKEEPKPIPARAVAPPTPVAPPPPPPLTNRVPPLHEKILVKSEPPPLAPVPNNKIILEEVNDVAHIKVDPKPKPITRPKPEQEPVIVKETLEEVTLPRGVQLKTVHTKHSPLKKHIISTAGHRREAITLPQIVTVAVSDTLKVRLQNHVLASQASSEAQNGPQYSTIHQVTATNTVPAREIETIQVSSSQLSNLTSVANVANLTSVSNVANVANMGRRVVLAAAPAHSAHSKLKLVPNTIQARAQILGTRGHVVSLGNPHQLQLKPSTPAQFIEIKPGHLLVRQHPPTHRPRLEMDQNKRRHLVATNIGVPRPHKLSVSLDGRQLVRAALPVRPHNHIQIKNRTLVAPHINNDASGSITISAPTKTASITSIPSSVVANLLQKNVQIPKSGQKIAISGGAALATIRGRQRIVARTHVSHEQPDSSTQPTATTSSTNDGERPATANNDVRRRNDVAPMEVT